MSRCVCGVSAEVLCGVSAEVLCGVSVKVCVWCKCIGVSGVSV